MARLNEERQRNLEPRRMAYAIEQIKNLGYEIAKQTENEIQFIHNGKVVKFFPYSGWATGATIKDGRGLKRLLTQLKETSAK
ncbi:MAG: hypothetical protein NC418_04565 [Muribaculaceae bacterium]|nr:hypothetical protein [Muribaculaceae bacterium]